MKLELTTGNTLVVVLYADLQILDQFLCVINVTCVMLLACMMCVCSVLPTFASFT